MAAIIREQVVAERDRRNQRAAQEHRRVVDAVIDTTLANRPDAAARLRQEAGAALDAKLKAGKPIEPPRLKLGADSPARTMPGAKKPGRER